MEAHMEAKLSLLILALLLALLAPTTTATNPLDASLETTQHITHHGTLTTTAKGGLATQITPTTNATLHAEHLQLIIHYEQGHRIGDGDPLQTRHVTDEGTQTPTFDDATLTLQPRNDPTPLIALPTDQTATLQATTTDQGTTQPLPEDAPLYRAGYSEATTTAGQGSSQTGHTQQAHAPLLAQHGHHRATLTGTFPLAVHNATLHIAHDEGTYTDWTGFNEDDPDAPSSAYEIRVATLQATNATLTLHTPRTTITALATTLTTTHQGTLTATRAHGTLTTATTTIDLQNDPLTLNGEGTLTLTATQTLPSQPPHLDLQATGDYELLAPTPTQTNPTTQTSPDVAWILPLTGLTLLLATATTLHQKPALLRRLPKPLKDKLETRLYERAHKHEYNDRWTNAQRAYHLLTILHPTIPYFWRHKILAHLEDQDPHQALQTIHEAHQALPEPNPDILELETLTHQDLDDPHQAQQALRRLVKLDPHQAQDFIFDLELHDLADDPDIQQAIGPNPGGGGIDGYT